MAKARIAPAAREDLRDIRVYSKMAFGAAAARAYLLGLRGAFTFLGEHRLPGTSEFDLGQNIRSFAYRSHRIYYRVDSSGLLIVRILHHAMDVPRAMGGGS